MKNLFIALFAMISFAATAQSSDLNLVSLPITTGPEDKTLPNPGTGRCSIFFFWNFFSTSGMT